jgi:hypothetical protein
VACVQLFALSRVLLIAPVACAALSAFAPSHALLFALLCVLNFARACSLSMIGSCGCDRVRFVLDL